jgi:diadenosine tetraphosphatase ApaH/serine/threonine PP2A family protein phosphatase
VINDAGIVDSVWCLGDLVGYGPDPNECVEKIRQLPNLSCIIGNHDAAALKIIDADTFNPEARTALVWTQNVLSQSNKVFLGSLTDRIVWHDVTLTHGSPRQPVWEYILDVRTATQNFEFFTTPLCFIGHTHLPVIYSYSDSVPYARLSIPEPNQRIPLPIRSIVNPGSVGQPRDRDPRAAYAIFDTETMFWEYRRIAYDFLAVQERMKEAGLPDRHIQRLSAGW